MTLRIQWFYSLSQPFYLKMKYFIKIINPHVILNMDGFVVTMNFHCMSIFFNPVILLEKCLIKIMLNAKFYYQISVVSIARAKHAMHYKDD